MGNLKRGGSLKRDQPISRSLIPEGQALSWSSGQGRIEAREGQVRESGSTVLGENSLKRRKPRRASALARPNRPGEGTDFRGEQSLEVELPQFAGCITLGAIDLLLLGAVGHSVVRCESLRDSSGGSLRHLRVR